QGAGGGAGGGVVRLHRFAGAGDGEPDGRPAAGGDRQELARVAPDEPAGRVDQADQVRAVLADGRRAGDEPTAGDLAATGGPGAHAGGERDRGAAAGRLDGAAHQQVEAG